MKGILIAVLLLTGLGLAQDPAANWGERILFGKTFADSDSLWLRSTSLTDTVLADTIYSGALEIKEWNDGVYVVAANFTNIGGTSDSLKIDVRLGYKFRDKNNNNAQTVKYGPWQQVFSTVLAAGLNTIGIAQSDSSWWHAASYRQYRLYDTSVSTDTTLHLVTDFLK